MGKCPKCKNEIKKVVFEVGYGIQVPSLHCDSCGFNITENKSLENAIKTLKENMAKEIRVIQIGNGLGIRIPNEIVKNLKIHKGDEILLKPEMDGLKIVTVCSHNSIK